MGLASNPSNHGEREGKKQSHSHSKVSEHTKSLEEPILQCLCMVAGMAGPPQGLQAKAGKAQEV